MPSNKPADEIRIAVFHIRQRAIKQEQEAVDIQRQCDRIMELSSYLEGNQVDKVDEIEEKK